MELMQASNQWMTRPDDQRFTSLDDLVAHVRQQRLDSRTHLKRKLQITAAPIADDQEGLAIVMDDGQTLFPSHWSFGQLCQRAEAPAGYLRTLESGLAADCINYGLANSRNEDLQILQRQSMTDPFDTLAAATGPQYGRIWNSDVADALRHRFGDGVTGDFTVPGKWGVALDSVTKEDTTIYASDRDMFVFLADEQNRITIPGRRGGRNGDMARGFFAWNSEVGSQTFGVATFLFDYVCGNRIVWGAEGYEEIRIRHTSGAPLRWIDEVTPAIEAYAQKSTYSIKEAIANARNNRLDEEQVKKLLDTRFTRNQAQAIQLAHRADEDRPMESVWDVVVGATAYARNIMHQDARVDIERKAGKLLTMAG